MKKIILFEGDIETQGYFSRQMEAALVRMGHQVFLYDLKDPWKSTSHMLRFIEKGNTVVLSFNFHGCCQEAQFLDESGTYIWDGLQIPVCNILADHPYYYYKLLAQRPQRYYQLSIDLGHEKFMERFFSEVDLGPFLPLGGTCLGSAVRAAEDCRCSQMDDEIFRRGKEDSAYAAIVKAGEEKFAAANCRKPISERPIDVLFTGNYAAPSRFEQYITRLGDEYTAFYYEMIEDLLTHPQQKVEDVVERYLRREVPQITEQELKETMQNITFIDLYIRYQVRGEIVRTLVDNGIRVHVFGDKWDELAVKHPENLINGDSLFSEECLVQTCESKICLNVLPWFREGPHDRIFNTMLNGSVCLTDSNTWLDEILRSGENAVLYDLTQIEKLPQIVTELLADEDRMQRIADAGRIAAQNHMWENRMEVFHRWVEELP